VVDLIVYICLLIFWLYFSIILKQTYGPKLKYNNKVYFFIGGVSLFFIMALRKETVGADLLSYKYEFENAEIFLENMLRKTELGYSYFNYWIYSLGVNFQLYISIIAFIVIYAISKLYFKFSNNIILSYYLFVTLGLFAMTMTGLRQTLAVSLTIIAFTFLMKNKKIVFFILVFLACFFHNSAIVFLLVYFIRKIKLTRKQGFVIYGMTCVLYLFREWLFIFITILTPAKYLRRYLEMDPNVNPLVIIVYMLIPLVCLLFWPKEYNENGNYNRLMSILLTISCFIFFCYFMALEMAMFERLTYYFMIYNTVLIPNIIQGIKEREMQILAKIACVIFPLIQFVISTPGGSLEIDIYKFFWE
jgi:hypothetical protein